MFLAGYERYPFHWGANIPGKGKEEIQAQEAAEARGKYASTGIVPRYTGRPMGGNNFHAPVANIQKKTRPTAFQHQNNIGYSLFSFTLFVETFLSLPYYIGVSIIWKSFSSSEFPGRVSRINDTIIYVIRPLYHIGR